MAMAFGDYNNDFAFSGYSTTTDNDQACNWTDWSPVLDWDALPHGRDDFHDVIDFSLMNVDGVAALQQDLSDGALQDTTSNSASPASSTDTMCMEEDSAAGDDFKGLRLVHLLMAAAEALTGANKSCELARVILVRLKELVSPTDDGSNMERLAAYFTDALHGLLDGGGSHGGGRHLITSGSHHHLEHNQSDILAAFQLLQDMSPYVKFGHFTANQAILEAVEHDRRIHIVDYDIMEGIQWASLMQALASRKDGPPSPHLRITALSRGGTGRRSISTVQETGRRLVAFAASIGQPFSFHQCRLDSDEGFKPSAVKLVRGEALIVNCMLHLPHSSHRAPESVASFLSGAKSLNPRLVTLVEEEVAPAADVGFVSRFMDSLHHFSAVYDSLEAGFPMQARARALVERVFLGPRITGSVARIYKTRDEEKCSWWEWLGAAGFSPVDVSFANHCQAKLLLGLFNDGFRAEELGRNRLALGWKSRRLISASVWTSSDFDF